jgi:hypothetical protein
VNDGEGEDMEEGVEREGRVYVCVLGLSESLVFVAEGRIFRHLQHTPAIRILSLHSHVFNDKAWGWEVTCHHHLAGLSTCFT